MSDREPNRTITPQLGAPIPQKQGPNRALIIGLVLVMLVLVVALLVVVLYGLNTGGGGGGDGGTHTVELNITVGSYMQWTLHNGSVSGAELATYRWTVLAGNGTTITINESTSLAGTPASSSIKNVTKADFLAGPTGIGNMYAFLPFERTQNLTTVFGARMCDVFGGSNILGTGENATVFVGQTNLVIYEVDASGNFTSIGGIGASTVTWVVSGGNIPQL